MSVKVFQVLNSALVESLVQLVGRLLLLLGLYYQQLRGHERLVIEYCLIHSIALR